MNQKPFIVFVCTATGAIWVFIAIVAWFLHRVYLKEGEVASTVSTGYVAVLCWHWVFSMGSVYLIGRLA
jgi:hypothetical protein